VTWFKLKKRKESSPLKATGTNDLLLRECAEDTRNNFKSWVFIILFETVVFGDFLTVSKKSAATWSGEK